ncbi:MAG: tetratricopeptide repeat protein [Nitrospirae bacterium]|nr:tetratricopeptide repeat protein [Nitrospirota bacterium]
MVRVIVYSGLGICIILALYIHFNVQPDVPEVRESKTVKEESLSLQTPPAREAEISTIEQVQTESLSESTRTENVIEQPATVIPEHVLRWQAAVEKLKAGRYQEAAKDFQELTAHEPKAYFGLGFSYFQLKEEEKALDALQEGLKHGEDAQARKLIGTIYYRKDELEKAIEHWQKAVELDPKDSLTRRSLEKAKSEKKAQGDNYSRESTRHFTLFYDGYVQRDVSRLILHLLEDAYSYVGSSFNHFPSEALTVILYTKEDFYVTIKNPFWSRGVYDGKIRIPVGGVDEKADSLLKPVIFHEYTHALVHSITQRCPTWINEGLAMYFEGRPKPSVKKKIPLRYLEGSFMHLGHDAARIAYKQSYSATLYLIDRYGLSRIKDLLYAFSKGKSIDDAFRDALSISYEDFSAEWQRQDS